MWIDPLPEVRALVRRGSADAALRHAQAVLIATEEAFGATHDNAALARIALGEAELAAGDHGAALRSFERANHLLRAEGALARVRAADALEGIGLARAAQGRTADAERAYIDAIEIRERDLGADHPSIARPLEKLASLYDDGRFEPERAEPLFRRAVRLLSHAPEQRIDLARVELALARLLVERGADADAEPLILAALEIERALYGASSPRLVDTLHLLAAVTARRGDPHRAEPLQREALALLGGEDEPTGAGVRLEAAMADVYRQMNARDLALEHYRRALAMRHVIGSAEDVDVASLEARIEELTRPPAHAFSQAPPPPRDG
jgi:tetratricopeptide (TPR) repeat protein